MLLILSELEEEKYFFSLSGIAVIISLSRLLKTSKKIDALAERVREFPEVVPFPLTTEEDEYLSLCGDITRMGSLDKLNQIVILEERRANLRKEDQELTESESDLIVKTLIQQKYEKLLELDPTKKDYKFVEDFMCPISYELMFDPVVIVSGHSFDRKSIEDAFTNSNINPFTREVLSSKEVYPNKYLRSKIEEILDELMEQAEKKIKLL